MGKRLGPCVYAPDVNWFFIATLIALEITGGNMGRYAEKSGALNDFMTERVVTRIATVL